MQSLLVKIGKQIGAQDPPMRAWLVVRDLSILKELHQGGATYAKEISGLLSGEPLRSRH